MHDRYRKRHASHRPSDRLRRQIAREAARQLWHRAQAQPQTPSQTDNPPSSLAILDPPALFEAKRQAVAILGRRVRPEDLPSDLEVRAEWRNLVRSTAQPLRELSPQPEGDLIRLADHVDRFAIYKLRLEPLADIKLPPRDHPEGDALYHSLQVFELAREARPYDEEFLTAALLHDVGKAVDPLHHEAAALEILEGSITPRTAWLIEHHSVLFNRPERARDAKIRRAVEASDFYEDLVLLHDLDLAGRIPGFQVPTIDEALQTLRDLEAENDDLPDPLPHPANSLLP